jgi:hypothetical protein
MRPVLRNLLFLTLTLSILQFWNVLNRLNDWSRVLLTHSTSSSSATQQHSLSHVSIRSATSICASHHDCLSCASHAQSNCLWCASDRSCYEKSSSSALHCLDQEFGFCSLIFLEPNPIRWRVIYVGKRSGGPEALIQLHLGLLHWGFNSTLETRKRQVGRSLLPFFRDAYLSEFEKFGLHFVKNLDYASFLASGVRGDTFLLTETWPCTIELNFSSAGRGVRQFQFHLTAQDRAHTYNVSHFYIPNAFPEACAVFAHTHYMTHRFLKISSKSTLVPYVTPRIVNLATSWRQKHQSSPDTLRLQRKNVILYDGDAGFDELRIEPPYRSMLRKAASIKPEVLYKLFEQTLLVIDFQMPGAERLVLEASLFDAIVVVDSQLNGEDSVDFPLPSKFRVGPKDYTAVNRLIKEIVEARGTPAHVGLVASMQNFRDMVQSQKVEFLKSVRRFFSDSVHLQLEYSRCRTLQHCLDLTVNFLVFAPASTVTIHVDDENLHSALQQSLVFTKFSNFLKAHYLLSSFSLECLSSSANLSAHVAAASPSVLLVTLLAPTCFVASYDFVGIVATRMHLWQSRKYVVLDDCLEFKFLSRGGEGGAGQSISSFDHSILHTAFVRTIGQVDSTLDSNNALWNDYRRVFPS